MPSEFEVQIKFLLKTDIICRYQVSTPHFHSRPDPEDNYSRQYKFSFSYPNPNDESIIIRAPRGTTNFYKVIPVIPCFRYKVALETEENNIIEFRIEVKDFFSTWISRKRPEEDVETWDTWEMQAGEGFYVMVPTTEGDLGSSSVVDGIYKVGCFIHELLIWGEPGCYIPKAVVAPVGGGGKR